MPSLASRVAASLARPPTDLRYLLPIVRTQGDRPLCVPFATTTAHEAARAFLDSVTAGEALAVEAIWQHCVENGRGDHNGTTIADAAAAADDRGQPTEQIWPYNPALGDGTEPGPPGAATANWHRTNFVDLPLAHDGVEDLLETALAAGFPVVVIIESTHEFEFPDPDGEVEVPHITSPLSDYHAITVVGAATSPDGAARRLLVRNSWGPGWGAGGYGWLPVAYLEAFAVQAAVLDPRSMTTY